MGTLLVIAVLISVPSCVFLASIDNCLPLLPTRYFLCSQQVPQHMVALYSEE